VRTGVIWGLSLGLFGAASLVHAAPPEGASEVPTAVDLPSWSPQKRAPQTGAGRIACGSLGLVAGTAIFVASTVGIATSPADDPGFALTLQIPGVILGGGLAAAGGVLLGTGIADRRVYREWELEQAPQIVPPRGSGMLGTGVTLLVAGASTMAFSFVEFDDTWKVDRPDPTFTGAVVTTTTAAVATLGGVGLVIGSMVLRRKHMRWQKTRMTPSLSPLPGARPGIGGLSFGLAGRF
jgi:hypothetical protein